MRSHAPPSAKAPFAQGELSPQATEGSPLTGRAAVRDPSVTAAP